VGNLLDFALNCCDKLNTRNSHKYEFLKEKRGKQISFEKLADRLALLDISISDVEYSKEIEINA
jgi:hypothetical protein